MGHTRYWEVSYEIPGSCSFKCCASLHHDNRDFDRSKHDVIVSRVYF